MGGCTAFQAEGAARAEALMGETDAAGTEIRKATGAEEMMLELLELRQQKNDACLFTLFLLFPYST